MRGWFFFFLSSWFLMSAYSLAQEETASTSVVALGNVVDTLGRSVEKLSLNNDALAARDTQMHKQLAALQKQLERVQARGNVLNQEAEKLRLKNAHEDTRVTRARAQEKDLDNDIQKIQGDIQLMRRLIGVAYQEDQKCLRQLKNKMSAKPLRPAPPSQISSAVSAQKEKLQLIKMIYDSQSRQKLLRQSILEYQKNAPLALTRPAVSRQEWNEDQTRQWTKVVKVLERNYDQLKILMEQIKQKSQNKQLRLAQDIEVRKLQNSIDALNHQGLLLRVSLDDLRGQMIDLDKRKSRLQAMLKG